MRRRGKVFAQGISHFWRRMAKRKGGSGRMIRWRHWKVWRVYRNPAWSRPPREPGDSSEKPRSDTVLPVGAIQ